MSQPTKIVLNPGPLKPSIHLKDLIRSNGKLFTIYQTFSFSSPFKSFKLDGSPFLPQDFLPIKVDYELTDFDYIFDKEFEWCHKCGNYRIELVNCICAICCNQNNCNNKDAMDMAKLIHQKQQLLFNNITSTRKITVPPVYFEVVRRFHHGLYNSEPKNVIDYLDKWTSDVISAVNQLNELAVKPDTFFHILSDEYKI